MMELREIIACGILFSFWQFLVLPALVGGDNYKESVLVGVLLTVFLIVGVAIAAALAWAVAVLFS